MKWYDGANWWRCATSTPAGSRSGPSSRSAGLTSPSRPFRGTLSVFLMGWRHICKLKEKNPLLSPRGAPYAERRGCDFVARARTNKKIKILKARRWRAEVNPRDGAARRSRRSAHGAPQRKLSARIMVASTRRPRGAHQCTPPMSVGLAGLCLHPLPILHPGGQISTVKRQGWRCVFR